MQLSNSNLEGVKQDSSSSICSTTTDSADFFVFNAEEKGTKKTKVYVCDDKKIIKEYFQTSRDEDKSKSEFVKCCKPQHRKKPGPRKMGHKGYVCDDNGKIMMGNSRGLDSNNNVNKKLHCKACAEAERMSCDKKIVYCCESWDIPSDHFFQHPYLEGTSDKKSTFQCTNCVLLSRKEDMTCKKVFSNKKYNKCFLNNDYCRKTCKQEEYPENFFRKFLRIGILNPTFGDKDMRIGKGKQGSEVLPPNDDEYVIKRKDFLAVVFKRLQEVINEHKKELANICEKSHVITENYTIDGAKDHVFENFTAMLGIWCQKGWRKGKLRSNWRLFPNGRDKSLLRENLVKELFYMTKLCNRKYCLFGCGCRYGVHQTAYRNLVFGKDEKSGIWNPKDNCYSVRGVLSDKGLADSIICNFAQEWFENYESKTPNFICLDQGSEEFNSEYIKERIETRLKDAIRFYDYYISDKTRDCHERLNKSKNCLKSALDLYIGNPLKNMNIRGNFELRTLTNVNLLEFDKSLGCVEGTPEILNTKSTGRTHTPFQTIVEKEIFTTLISPSEKEDDLLEQKDILPKQNNDYSEIWEISQNSKNCIIM